MTNCGNSLLTVTTPTLISGTSQTLDGFVQDSLYNFGFMLEDVLDLIVIDPNNQDPFWYYVFYRVGDFAIRLLYNGSGYYLQ